MIVPFFDTTRQMKLIRNEIDSAIRKVLDSGKFILGEELEKFEKKFSNYIGVKYGIGVNSGTDAIKIALRSLGIKENDEVITVANTAVPTVSAIREIGAIPVFVDIDEYFNIDPKDFESKITSKTKAVVIVHLYGQPADINSITKIAKKYKIKVVEDCAQATGAEIETKKVGSMGDMSCFSFYPTKNLGAYGDGGMILTNDEELAKKCRQLRMYGMKKTYYSNMEGFNSRLDEIQATILNAKLDCVESWNNKRIRLANFYLKNIRNKDIELPKKEKATSQVFNFFILKTEKRKKLKEYLKKNGVGFGIHYEFPIHLQKGYEFLGYKKDDLPITEKVSNEIISLPIFPELTDREIEYIVEKINKFS